MRRREDTKQEQSDPTVNQMVTLTRECRDKAVKKAYNIFGKRRGAISMYFEYVLRIDLSLGQKGVTEL